MGPTIHSRHQCGDMVALYRTREGQLDLVIHPAGLEPVEHRDDAGAEAVEGLVQLHVRGDDLTTSFLGARSMRRGGTRLDLVAHDAADDAITTSFTTAHGLDVVHRLQHRDQILVSTVTVRNDSNEPLTIDLLSSFSIAGITPYAHDDAPGRLVLHRWRSRWSLEGRMVSEPVEDLGLAPDYGGYGAGAERWGQVGTMPVRGWFPQTVVEDAAVGVCWGAQVAWGGSWQLEAYRRRDDLCLSGGLADRELGHWSVRLDPGETLTTPEARLTVVRGTVDDACDRLVNAMLPATLDEPASERELPLIVNEWCTTWGRPTHEGVLALADWLLDHGITPGYLVIDAGWYRPDTEAVTWFSSHGDWQAAPSHFPYGLTAVADGLRKRGIIPGLWFEFETVGTDSAAGAQTDHLLHRDGVPITVGVRRFWDLNDPWVSDYLTARVTHLLRDNGFGYVKVDYNETLGLGCDHPDSLGEGLRQNVLASHRFFDSLRAEIPDLVIENCSSGGHRLEPSYVSRTAMSSFSDAHEPPEIPVIAAALHRLIPARQSQIWAVLKSGDSPERLRYSLAAGFLGRLCLSGELTQLSEEQAAVVRDHAQWYGTAAPIIAHGTSRHDGTPQPNWRHLTGWQAVVRTSSDRASALVVAHTFSGCPTRVTIALPPGVWTTTVISYGQATVVGGDLVLDDLTPHDARVVILQIRSASPDPSTPR